MYFCRCPVVWSSVDGRPTPKMSPDGRPIVGRWTTDGQPVPNRSVPTSVYFNVNVRHRPILESQTG